MTASRDYVDSSSSLSYIDLLVDMLMRHEKNLSRLVERLERILSLLDNVDQTMTAEKRRKEKLGTLYI